MKKKKIILATIMTSSIIPGVMVVSSTGTEAAPNAESGDSVSSSTNDSEKISFNYKVNNKNDVIESNREYVIERNTDNLDYTYENLKNGFNIG
ncbi:UNVERIFIED_CONTAM: hypothetical protein O8I53_13240 [Campylobacter lari]